MKKTLFVLTAAAMVAMPVMAQNQRPGVAVFPFDASAIQPDFAPLGKGIPALMITELARNQSIRVVERDQIQKILDEQKLGTSGSLDPATVIKVGKLVGARYMIAGGFITDPGRNLRIDVRCWDAETGEIIYTDKTSGKLDALIDVIQQAATKTSSGLKLPPMPAASRGDASASAEKAKKMPLATAMLYARAIEAGDAGKTAEAKTLYKQVLDKFPGYGPAEEAMKKLP